jgi:putative exosortase-associated protein (TIGR04073 family)
MRKFLSITLIFGLSFLIAATGYTEDKEVDPDRIVNTEISRSHNKIKRGAINMVTAPLEIIKQTKETVEEGETTPKRLGRVIPGLFKGMGYTVLRFGSGLWDLATFNNFFYEEHEPVIKPDYVWDEKDK